MSSMYVLSGGSLYPTGSLNSPTVCLAPMRITSKVAREKAIPSLLDVLFVLENHMKNVNIAAL